MRKRIGVITVLLVVVLALGSLLACSSSAPATSSAPAAPKVTSVRLLGTQPGVGTYQIASAWATIVNLRLHTLKVNLSPTAGYLQEMSLIQKNEADIGQIQNWVLRSLTTGKGQPWEGLTPMTDINNILISELNYYTFIVRQDSGIKTVADLKGKRIGNLDTANTSHYSNLELLKALGYNPDTDLKVLDGSVADLSARLKEGAIDGQLFPTAIGSAVIVDLFTATPLTLLEIPQSAIDKLNSDSVYGAGAFIPATIPAGTYKGQTAAVKTAGAPTGQVAPARVPEDVVYQMVKIWFEYQKEAIDIWAGIGTITQQVATQPISVPTHPGALKYYKEKGWRQ